MKRPHVIIALLVLLFAAPGIGAYLLYTHPHWLKTTTNHGRILQLSQRVSALDNHNKWQLIYWSPGVCDRSCEKNVDKLARIRLALGRRLYQVDVVLLINSNAPPIADRLHSQLQEEDGRELRVVTHEDRTILGIKPAIYIANPEHYVILAYDESQSADEIFQDLKQLVRDK